MRDLSRRSFLAAARQPAVSLCTARADDPPHAIRRPGNRSTLTRSPTVFPTEARHLRCTGALFGPPASLPRGGSRMC